MVRICHASGMARRQRVQAYRRALAIVLALALVVPTVLSIVSLVSR